MWIGERVDDRKNPTTAEFSLCCMNGKVELPLLTKPPEPLYSLLNGDHVQSSNYLDNIRTYNSMFSFTLLVGRIDKKMNDGGGPPQCTLSGQNFHRMGSLMPEEGGTPKFAQLYIYDTQNETTNRMKYFRKEDGSYLIDETLVESLKQMVDAHNELVKKFRQVRDHVEHGGSTNFFIRLFGNRTKDLRVHNLPTCDEVAALIIGDPNSIEQGRDVIVRNTQGEYVRMYETYVSFLPLLSP